MVTTRHVEALEAAAQAAAARQQQARAREQQEREERERTRVEKRARQAEAAEQRTKQQERRAALAERKRKREERWVQYCNRQNEHIASMHEGWQAPPPKPLPPPVAEGEPPLKKRKQTKRWSVEEEAALEAYVEEHGLSNWAFILRQDKQGQRMFHTQVTDEDGELQWVPARTAVQLKDKHRTLERRRAGWHAPPHHSRARRELTWSKAEEHALVSLVVKHGAGNWQFIKESPEGRAVLHDLRTNVDLKTKWDRLQRSPVVAAQLRAQRLLQRTQEEQQEEQQEEEPQQEQQPPQREQRQPQRAQKQQKQQQRTPAGHTAAAAAAAGRAARAGRPATRSSREVGRPTPARRKPVQRPHTVQPQRLDFGPL